MTLKKEDELFIGSAMSALVKTLSIEKKVVFFASVRRYYVTACDYMFARVPLRDPVLHQAHVADTVKMATSKYVMFFVDKFPSIVTKKGKNTLNEGIDKFHQQFNYSQRSLLPLCIFNYEREDTKRMLLSSEKLDILAFDRQAPFMVGVLTIPYSEVPKRRTSGAH